MKKSNVFLASLLLSVGGFALNAAPVDNNNGAVQSSNPYELPERFTAPKLSKMLFSTTVDPHWFPTGDKFWYSYKTSEGNRWYVVDPVARRKSPMFDHDKMAADLTYIVKDPYIAAQLPIRNLEVQPDGYTYTFEVTSSQDAAPKKDDKKADKKSKKPKKEVFYFSYDSRNGQLTHLKDKEKEEKELKWASVSPDGEKVVYAKDFNLWMMSGEDYAKLKKDEKDSTITEIQLTTDGVRDFGYGVPYSWLNTDTLDNGKRRGAYILWSPDSRHFISNIEDGRKVGELWVINAIADPRPTLETYKYEMPGEENIPQQHLYLFNVEDRSRKEIDTQRFKDQSLTLIRRPSLQKQRDQYDVPNIWLGDDNRFFLTRSSRDLHRIDVCTYTIGQDTIVPIIEERLNTYQNERPLAAVNNGKEIVQWSERDGWAHLYLYAAKGNLKLRLTDGPW
ncbi:MAG: DPP IV N-terminal domain-containing protein, partial [Muribaculaceae bacterium]|nr:DPP IV N-terminal domain-containing protein [Muribaculaceae bacterium]